MPDRNHPAVLWAEPDRILSRAAAGQDIARPVAVQGVESPSKINDIYAEGIEHLLGWLCNLLDNIINPVALVFEFQMLEQVIVCNRRDTGAGCGSQVD